MKPVYIALIATICATTFAILSLEAMAHEQYFIMAVCSFFFGASSATMIAAAVEDVKRIKRITNERARNHQES